MNRGTKKSETAAGRDADLITAIVASFRRDTPAGTRYQRTAPHLHLFAICYSVVRDRCLIPNSQGHDTKLVTNGRLAK